MECVPIFSGHTSNLGILLKYRFWFRSLRFNLRFFISSKLPGSQISLRVIQLHYGVYMPCLSVYQGHILFSCLNCYFLISLSGKFRSEDLDWIPFLKAFLPSSGRINCIFHCIFTYFYPFLFQNSFRFMEELEI